jgi:glycosyltransferase involved in cell wall biosynthesis
MSLRVCILSRKDLSNVTRVSRQAEALVRAGHEVTVVSLKRPDDAVIARTPEVEYVEVALDDWPRRRLTELRRRRRARQAQAAKRRPAAGRPPARPRLVRDRLPALLLAGPTALLLSAPGERRRGRARELAAMELTSVLTLYTHVLAQPVASRSFAHRACAALEGRDFDVCQAHDNYALVAARRLAARTGADLVYDAVEITEHRIAVRSTPLHRLAEALQRRQEARILRSARAVVTIGDGLADWYAERYGIERPLPVRNCRWYWPYERSDAIRADCGLAEGERLVVWFGYAYPAQGLETIVEAAAHLPADVHVALLAHVLPRWTEFRAGVEARAAALGLAGRVHFLPPRDPEDLVPYVSGADVGIIPRPNVGPNVYYSMPNKFMEMVMARLPVAVSDLADMRILAERHGVGRVFDVDDPADVARTLEAMLEPAAHAALRERTMAAAEELCWERESRRYVELFGPPSAPAARPAVAGAR